VSRSRIRTPSKVNHIEPDFDRAVDKIDGIYSSAEKFKDNEKNLSEDRLKRESKIEIPIQKVNTLNHVQATTVTEVQLKDDLVTSNSASRVNNSNAQGGMVSADSTLKRNVSQNTF